MRPPKAGNILSWLYVFFLVLGLVFLGIGAGIGIWLFSFGDLPLPLLVLPGVLLLLGLVFAIIAVVNLAKGRARRKQEQWLRENGTVLEATYLDCVPDFSVTVNERPMLTVRCIFQTPDGNTHMFSRGRLWQDPEPYLRDGILRVYCQPDDWNVYFVDLEGSYDPDIVGY